MHQWTGLQAEHDNTVESKRRRAVSASDIFVNGNEIKTKIKSVKLK